MKPILVALVMVLAAQEVALASHANAPGTFDRGGADAIHDDAGDHPLALTSGRFPLDAPAYANSQVYPPANPFSMPWEDNFCEARTNVQPNPWCDQGDKDRKHQGQDIRPKTNESGVYHIRAAWAGTVTTSTCGTGPGNYAVIKHTIGSLVLRTKYFHMSSAPSVAVGASVTTGQSIGRVGRTSTCSSSDTSIHLHFETWRWNTSLAKYEVVCPYPTLVDQYHRLTGGCTGCL